MSHALTTANCDESIVASKLSPSFFQRLRRRWTALAAWKRGVAVLLLVCVVMQFEIGRRLWREAQIREQLASHSNFFLGTSPLPIPLERQLRRVLGNSRMDLLRPVERIWMMESVDADVQAAMKLGSLKEVAIIDGELTPDGLATIRSMPHLKSLYLQNTQTLTGGLTGLPTCPKLDQLKLDGRLEAQALKPLANCSSLTELHLDNHSLESDESLAIPNQMTEHHFAAIGQIPNLRRLVIYQSTAIPDTDLAALASAGQLRELYVSSVTLNGDTMNSLCHLPSLRKIVMYSPFSNSGVQWRPSGFRALHALRVSGAHINIESLSRLPQLETLSLPRCSIYGNLASVNHIKNLKHLDLFLTNVTAEKLLEVEHHDLESLFIPYELISDEEKLKRFPNLKAISTLSDVEFPPYWGPSGLPAGSVGGNGFF